MKTLFLCVIIALTTHEVAYGQTNSNHPDFTPKCGKYQQPRIRNDSSHLKGQFVVVRVDPMIDITDQTSKYELWDRQNRVNAKAAIYGTARGGGIYNLKNVKNYAVIYYDDERPSDETPPPSIIVSFSLIDLSITRGIKHPNLMAYECQDEHTNHYGYIDYETRYASAYMQGVMHVTDAETCLEILSFTDKAEVRVAASGHMIEGNETVIPKAYTMGINSFPRDVSEQKAVMKAQNELLSKLLGRFYSNTLQRIVKKRHSIKTINTHF